MSTKIIVIIYLFFFNDFDGIFGNIKQIMWFFGTPHVAHANPIFAWDDFLEKSGFQFLLKV